MADIGGVVEALGGIKFVIEEMYNVLKIDTKIVAGGMTLEIIDKRKKHMENLKKILEDEVPMDEVIKKNKDIKDG